MRKQSLCVALLTSVILGLSGCGGAGDTTEVVDSMSDATETETTTEEQSDDGSLEDLLFASQSSDYLLEYRIDEAQVTLLFLQLNAASADGQAVAMSIIPDESGTLNFTAAKAGTDTVDNPFNEITGSTGFTPGLLVTPSPTGTTYTWTNPPVSWKIEADSNDRVSYYRMDSPEGVFEMNFFYDSELDSRVPKAFRDGVIAELDASGSEYLFGLSTDNFQTWEIYNF